MSNVLAGIGIAQLAVLDDRVHARRAVFERYKEALSGIEGIEFMPEAGMSNRWLTTLTLNQQRFKQHRRTSSNSSQMKTLRPARYGSLCTDSPFLKARLFIRTMTRALSAATYFSAGSACRQDQV